MSEDDTPKSDVMGDSMTQKLDKLATCSSPKVRQILHVQNKSIIDGLVIQNVSIFVFCRLQQYVILPSSSQLVVVHSAKSI